MIGEALRLIRVFHDLKQYDLASRLEISQSHLSEIERGIKIPSNELIARYADEFDLPVSSIWFFDENIERRLSTPNLEKARGIIADKVIDFLRLIEHKTRGVDNEAS